MTLIRRLWLFRFPDHVIGIRAESVDHSSPFELNAVLEELLVFLVAVWVGMDPRSENSYVSANEGEQFGEVRFSRVMTCHLG